MGVEVPYTARQDDLYYPCKNAIFFPTGTPGTEAGLCAEMSRLAYCRHEEDFAFDRPKVQGVLGTIGFEACDFFESQGRPKAQGPNGFLAVRQATGNCKKLAVLAFRGTDKDDPTDLAEDADFILVKRESPCRGRVHEGFARALADLLPAITPALAKIDCDILFTGHSLGAAMAALMASLHAPKALYTFGSPRVGDEEFVESISEVECYRYIDCCDVVARIPPAFVGYRHHGKRMYIDRLRNVLSDPGDEFIEKDRLQAEIEYREKYSWHLGNVGVRALADHAPFNYVMPVLAEELPPSADDSSH
jgi:triacylglycerol lipase